MTTNTAAIYLMAHEVASSLGTTQRLLAFYVADLSDDELADAIRAHQWVLDVVSDSVVSEEQRDGAITLLNILKLVQVMRDAPPVMHAYLEALGLEDRPGRPSPEWSGDAHWYASEIVKMVRGTIAQRDRFIALNGGDEHETERGD
jgi:hypothetical protein